MVSDSELRELSAYAAWIVTNVPEPRGKCAAATLAMSAAFPELKRVRGHYECYAWGRRDHWWLVTTDGQIVDPTAAQFPSHGLGEYIERDESLPEPTGKCPDCGEFVYGRGTFCSRACSEAFRRSCGPRS